MMRVRVWGARRGAKPDESPVWRDLEEHAHELEALARAIRHDIAQRDAGTARRALDHMAQQSRHAHEQVDALLGEAARPRLVKAPVFKLKA
jgi:hypothetical protein